MPRTRSQLKRDIEPPVALNATRYAMPIAKLFDPHPIIISTLKWTGHVCQLTEAENIGTVTLLSSDTPTSERIMMHDQCLMFHPEVDVVAFPTWS